MLVTATVEIRIFPSLSWNKISSQRYHSTLFHSTSLETIILFLDIHL